MLSPVRLIQLLVTTVVVAAAILSCDRAFATGQISISVDVPVMALGGSPPIHGSVTTIPTPGVSVTVACDDGESVSGLGVGGTFTFSPSAIKEYGITATDVASDTPATASCYVVGAPVISVSSPTVNTPITLNRFTQFATTITAAASPSAPTVPAGLTVNGPPSYSWAVPAGYNPISAGGDASVTLTETAESGSTMYLTGEFQPVVVATATWTFSPGGTIRASSSSDSTAIAADYYVVAPSYITSVGPVTQTYSVGSPPTYYGFHSLYALEVFGTDNRPFTPPAQQSESYDSSSLTLSPTYASDLQHQSPPPPGAMQSSALSNLAFNGATYPGSFGDDDSWDTAGWTNPAANVNPGDAFLFSWTQNISIYETPGGAYGTVYTPAPPNYLATYSMTVDGDQAKRQ